MNTVDDRLEQNFPEYQSDKSKVAWESLKRRIPLGTPVKGKVVLQEEFGIFFDIGVGFPCLILVVRLKNADRKPYTNMSIYPAIDSIIEGKIYVFNDNGRQIGVTQFPKEKWMEGNW